MKKITPASGDGAYLCEESPADTKAPLDPYAYGRARTSQILGHFDPGCTCDHHASEPCDYTCIVHKGTVTHDVYGRLRTAERYMTCPYCTEHVWGMNPGDLINNMRIHFSECANISEGDSK